MRHVKAFVINHYATNKGDAAVGYALTQMLLNSGFTHVTISANQPAYCDLGGMDGRFVDVVPWGWPEIDVSTGRIARLRRRAVNALFSRIAYVRLRSKLLAGNTATRWAACATPQFVRALRAADLVLSTGGHHLTTLTAPDAVYAQTYDLAIAAASGKPLIFWSQSYGPFEFRAPANGDLVRWVLNRAAMVTAREVHSRRALEELGHDVTRVRIVPETVYSLYDSIPATKRIPGGKPSLGISVYTIKQRSQAEYEKYTDLIATAVRWSQNRGYRVIFFPMSLHGDDCRCIKDIIKKAQGESVCVVLPAKIGLMEHLAAVQECDLFLGHKTHSIVFSLIAGTPLVALAYHQKASEFMSQFGLAQYAFNDQRVTSVDLRSALDEVHLRKQEIRDALESRAQVLGENVRQQLSATISYALDPSRGLKQ